VTRLLWLAADVPFADAQASVLSAYGIQPTVRSLACPLPAAEVLSRSYDVIMLSPARMPNGGGPEGPTGPPPPPLAPGQTACLLAAVQAGCGLVLDCSPSACEGTSLASLVPLAATGGVLEQQQGLAFVGGTNPLVGDFDLAAAPRFPALAICRAVGDAELLLATDAGLPLAAGWPGVPSGDPLLGLPPSRRCVLGLAEPLYPDLAGKLAAWPQLDAFVAALIAYAGGVRDLSSVKKTVRAPLAGVREAWPLLPAPPVGP